MAFGLFEIFQEVDQRIARALVRIGVTGNTLDAGSVGGALPPTVLPDLAGDVTGPPGTNVVEAIQGIAIDPAAPTTGDVLTATSATDAEWASPGAFTDVLAKVSSNDTTAGYLNGKLTAGTGITFTENNDGGNEDLEISATPGGSAHVIEEETTPLTQRSNLSFQGAGVVATDDAGNNRTVVTIAGGGSGGTIYTSAYASPPGSPANGDWWYPSDSVGLYAARISGAWQWFFGGLPVSLPVAVASWTWVNQGTSVATDVGGGIFLITPIGSTAQNYRCLVKTAPSTPYTITAAFLPDIWGGDAATDSVNLICRESGTGKIQGPLWANSGAGVYHQQMTSATVHSSNPSNAGAWYQAQPVWLRLTDNGTNIISYVSADGRNWDQIYTQSRTAFMAAGPNQVGWAVNGHAAVGQGAATLVAWMET